MPVELQARRLVMLRAVHALQLALRVHLELREALLIGFGSHLPNILARACLKQMRPSLRYRTTPAAGLLAVAYSFFSIRPARYALRPASTASFMASAICSAFSAAAIAVFISTPS